MYDKMIPTKGKRGAMNPNDIITHIARLYEWSRKTDPTAKPLGEYLYITGLSPRQVQQALLAIEDEQEYEQLENFYTKELRFGDNELEQRLNRSNTEFKFLREYCGLSQHELAAKLGTSVSTERRWEAKDEAYTPSREAWQTIDRLRRETDKKAENVLDALYQRYSETDCEELDDGRVNVIPLPTKTITLYLFDNQDDYSNTRQALHNLFDPYTHENPEPYGAMTSLDPVNLVVQAEHADGDESPYDWRLEYRRAELQYGAYLAMAKTADHACHNAIMRVAYTLAQSDKNRFTDVRITNGATLLEQNIGKESKENENDGTN